MSKTGIVPSARNSYFLDSRGTRACVELGGLKSYPDSALMTDKSFSAYSSSSVLSIFSPRSRGKKQEKQGCDRYHSVCVEGKLGLDCEQESRDEKCRNGRYKRETVKHSHGKSAEAWI